jgi:hypothetical protein
MHLSETAGQLQMNEKNDKKGKAPEAVELRKATQRSRFSRQSEWRTTRRRFEQ